MHNIFCCILFCVNILMWFTNTLIINSKHSFINLCVEVKLLNHKVAAFQRSQQQVWDKLHFVIMTDELYNPKTNSYTVLVRRTHCTQRLPLVLASHPSEHLRPSHQNLQPSEQQSSVNRHSDSDLAYLVYPTWAAWTKWDISHSCKSTTWTELLTWMVAHVPYPC